MRCEQRGVAAGIVGIQQQPPVVAHGADDVARGLRRGRACGFQLPLGFVEARLEDQVVGLTSASGDVSPAAPAAGAAQQTSAGGEPAAALHGRLVRICCFSVWRSRASAMRRSRRSGYGTPEAAHIFEYMLIVVKPGMVLISLTYNCPSRRPSGSRRAPCRRSRPRGTPRSRAV